MTALADRSTRPTRGRAEIDDADTLSRAVASLAAGRPVIVIAHGSTALAYGAYGITTVQMADLITRTSGFVQIALPGDRCDELLLPEAAPTIRDRYRNGYGQCVSVDAASGVTTGISAADRAHTARLLCAPTTTPTDLSRPGHVVPVGVGGDDDMSPATVARLTLTLTGRAFPMAGAAYAELVSQSDPVRPISRGEVHDLAGRDGIVVVSG